MICIDTKGMTYGQSIKCRKYLNASYRESFSEFGQISTWFRDFRYLALSDSGYYTGYSNSYTGQSIPWQKFFAPVFNFAILTTHRTRKLQ